MKKILKKLFRSTRAPSTNFETLNCCLQRSGFIYGRMISGSKRGYRNIHPDNFVVFNANIFTTEYGKVFYGDIDITKEHQKLIDIANECNITLYILSEMDDRFDNQNRKDFKNVAVWNTESGLSEDYKRYFTENLKRRK